MAVQFMEAQSNFFWELYQEPECEIKKGPQAGNVQI